MIHLAFVHIWIAIVGIEMTILGNIPAIVYAWRYIWGLFLYLICITICCTDGLIGWQ